MIMQSKKIIYIAACCLLATFFSSIAWAEVSAQVDRNRLALDETLTLTISRDGSSFFSDPDLSVLEKDFRLLGQSQTSNIQIGNGSRASVTKWTVGLAPKRAGRVVIPSLKVGKEQTEPINIQIEQAAPPKTRADGVGFFLETDLDREEVYVQSQLIFTLRIFWAVQAQVNDPGDLVLADALVEKLGDATFNKRIDGRLYKVFERKFAIFPQKSGVLDIPSMSVEAMVPVARQRSNYFDPFGKRGKQVRLRSNSAKVMVLEKPSSYPANSAWLPADNFTVREQWSHDPKDLKVGESITITITTTAQGLMGAQLPPIVVDEIDKIKLYQNKAEEANSNGAGGITGVRTETIALIPTRPGELELPEIRIPWWDKQQDKVRYAVAPATRLVIHGTAPQAMAPVLSQPTQPLVAAANETKVPALPGSVPLFWVILCAGLGVAWLITIFLLLRTRRRLANLGEVVSQPQTAINNPALDGDAAIKQLKNACRENNGAPAKTALVAWAKAFWPEQVIISGADLGKIDPEFAQLLEELDSHLYGRDGGEAWNGGKLWAKVQEARSVSKKNGKKKGAVLPSLYNN